MSQSITIEMLEFLLREGYTYLVADNQAAETVYQFRPVKWDVDAFHADLMYYSYDDHMIVSISDAIRFWQIEDYLCHTIVMPKYL